MGNEPNGICGIFTDDGGTWAVVGLNGVKLKTGGAVDEAGGGGGGEDAADEGGGFTPAGGAWAKKQ